MESEGEFKESMLLFAFYRRKKRRKKQRRHVWVRTIFVNRKQQGSYSTLIQEMRLTDSISLSLFSHVEVLDFNNQVDQFSLKRSLSTNFQIET